MQINLTYLEDSQHPQFQPLLEQTEYLKGVLLADPAIRMNRYFHTREIDAYGTGTRHLWRGVIETAGSFRMDGGRYKYPLIELKGSHAFLTVFLAFLEEELGIRVPGPVSLGDWAGKFDGEGKLAFQTLGGYILLKGVQAQDAARLLYRGRTVGSVTHGHVADEMLAWFSQKRRP